MLLGRVSRHVRSVGARSFSVKSEVIAEHDGKAVKKFTLDAGNGLRGEFISYGCTITSLKVPDRNGVSEEVTLCWKSFDDIAAGVPKNPFYGATCGRVANRTCNGRWTLDGKEYQLAKNEGGTTHLHGGNKGFDKKVWDAEPIEGAGYVGVRMTLVSEDGDEGYPGELKVVGEYRLTDDTLWMVYTATTDKPTPVNLTNHGYWNLSGDFKEPIAAHTLQLMCDRYTPTNELQIPLGELKDVAGSPFDFRTPALLGDRMKLVKDRGGDNGNVGFDHNFVRDEKLDTTDIAVLSHRKSGRVMTVATTEPAVQVYTGNFLPTDGEFPHTHQNAMCLEAHHYPDSMNHPNFPSIVLRPGETYRNQITHKFTTVSA